MAVVLGSAGALGGGATYALTADAVSGPPKDGDQKDGDQKDGVHSGSAGDTSDASSSGSSGGGGSSASERGDNAARDMTILLTLGGNLPGIIVPSLCGSLVTDFSSRAEGYRLFWVLLHIHLEPFSLSKTQHQFTKTGAGQAQETLPLLPKEESILPSLVFSFFVSEKRSPVMVALSRQTITG